MVYHRKAKEKGQSIVSEERQKRCLDRSVFIVTTDWNFSTCSANLKIDIRLSHG